MQSCLWNVQTNLKHGIYEQLPGSVFKALGWNFLFCRSKCQDPVLWSRMQKTCWTGRRTWSALMTRKYCLLVCIWNECDCRISSDNHLQRIEGLPENETTKDEILREAWGTVLNVHPRTTTGLHSCLPSSEKMSLPCSWGTHKLPQITGAPSSCSTPRAGSIFSTPCTCSPPLYCPLIHTGGQAR